MKKKYESFWDGAGRTFFVIGTLAIMEKVGIYGLPDNWTRIIFYFVFGLVCAFLSD